MYIQCHTETTRLSVSKSPLRSSHALFFPWFFLLALVIHHAQVVTAQAPTCSAGTVVQAVNPTSAICSPCENGCFCQLNAFNVFGATDDQVTFDSMGVRGDRYADVANDPSGTYALVTEAYRSRVLRVSIATGTVSTLAGSGASKLRDGVGTLASFSAPSVVAIEPAGNYALVSDSYYVRRIYILTGAVSTVAGNGASQFADGVGTMASFQGSASSQGIAGIAFEPSGNYVLVTDAARVRRISVSSWTVSTLAGSSNFQYADGIGTQASFKQPIGVAVDPTGTYSLVADYSDNRIRRIEISSGVVSTLAGSGTGSFADGVGLQAAFYSPVGVAIDPTGTYALVSDINNMRIRRIAILTAVVSTLASQFGVNSFSPVRISIDPMGTHVLVSTGVIVGSTEGPLRRYSMIKLCPSGSFCNSQINPCVNGSNCDSSFAVSSSFDAFGTRDGQVKVSTFAGSGTAQYADGIGTSASFSLNHLPYTFSGIAFDPAGAFSIVADSGNHRIRRISISDGAVSTIAGSGAAQFANGVGALASFSYPEGVAIDPSGTFALVADGGNNCIRRVSIQVISSVVTTLAGVCGINMGTADGVGTLAMFWNPHGVAFDPSGTFALVTENHRVRRVIIATGNVSTLAGGGPGTNSDGIGTAAAFQTPTGIAIDPTGTYAIIADSLNYLVRRVLISTGSVSTVAGSGIAKYADGVGTLASFSILQGIAIDPSALYALVTDSFSHRIRRISLSTWVVSTLAGSGAPQFSDGIGTQASVSYPTGVAISPSSKFVLIVDAMNQRIRRVGFGTDCPPGSFCVGGSPSSLCTAGSYCPGGSSSPSPFICPLGLYCPIGTATPLPCASGSYCPAGSSSQNQVLCTAGYFCLSNSSVPSLLCDPGHYCNAGSSTPRQFACSTGVYCPSGSSTNDLPCPAGFSCSGGSDKVNCSAGYYCNQGTPSNPAQLCPVGSFCASGASSPTLCTTGAYCQTAGLSAPTGLCPTLAQCPAGSMFPTGHSASTCLTSGFFCNLGSTSVFGCMPGNFCPGGAASVQTPCPAGSLCSLSMMSVPVPCPAGSFCPFTGLTAPSAVCPVGSMCPTGSSVPQNCTRGMLCASSGVSAASACPAGRYCSSSLSLSCATGTYSFGNADACSPCPLGLFSSAAGSSSCQLCVPGHYSLNSSKSTCTKCSSTSSQECLLGARFPTPIQNTAVKSFSPVTAINSANLQQMSEMSTVVAVVFALVVLVIIVFGIVVEKYQLPSTGLLVAMPCRLFGFRWRSLDLFFSSQHYVPDGNSMVIRRTSFGASMSLATLFFFVGAGTVLGVNLVRFPTYTTSVSPQPAPWQPNGVFELRVTVYGGGLDLCAAGPANGFGIVAQSADWSELPTQSPNRFNSIDGSCRLTWRCEGRCSMVALEKATLLLRSPSRSWASAVSFTMITPLFASSSSIDDTFGSVPFQLSTGFYVSPPSLALLNETYAIRGPRATNVQISLSPVVLMDSNNDFASVAFEPSLLGINYGDITSFGSFDFSSNDGFTIAFLMSRSSMSSVMSAKSGMLNFLVQLSTLAASIISAFAFIFKVFQWLFNIDGSAQLSSDSARPPVESSEKDGIELTELNFDHVTSTTYNDASEIRFRSNIHDVNSVDYGALLQASIVQNELRFDKLTSLYLENQRNFHRMERMLDSLILLHQRASSPAVNHDSGLKNDTSDFEADCCRTSELETSGCDRVQLEVHVSDDNFHRCSRTPNQTACIEKMSQDIDIDQQHNQSSDQLVLLQLSDAPSDSC